MTEIKKPKRRSYLVTIRIKTSVKKENVRYLVEDMLADGSNNPTDEMKVARVERCVETWMN